MGSRPVTSVCAICFCLFQLSCSRSVAPEIKGKVPLAKVTGTILVDGVPTSGVILRYKPQGEIAEKREQFTHGFAVRSMSKGLFALKTYKSGDGLPAGTYDLYCEYFPAEGEDPRRTATEDVLGGQYSEGQKPAKTFAVDDSKPVDLGNIELTRAQDKQGT